MSKSVNYMLEIKRISDGNIALFSTRVEDNNILNKMLVVVGDPELERDSLIEFLKQTVQNLESGNYLPNNGGISDEIRQLLKEHGL